MICIKNRVTLFTLVRLLSIVFGKSCMRSEDCDTATRKCGVCMDKNSAETECFYHYPKIQVEKGKCYFVEDRCKNYSCENGNERSCKTDFGVAGPYCACDYSKMYMGQHCELKWDKVSMSESWVTGFAVFFDQFRTISKSLEVYTVQVFATVFSSYKTLQFNLETSEGFTIKFDSSTDCARNPTERGNKRIYPYYPMCQTCFALLPDCILLYQAKVQFPYKIAGAHGVINRSGNVIGYMANVTLVAKTKYQEVYRNIHPIMINYEYLQPDERQHMPSIELQNCGRNLRDRIFYYRTFPISLNAKVKDTPRDSVHTIWKIWAVQHFRNEYDFSDVFQINGGYSWTFKPFTLDTGIYRVQLKVTVFFGTKSVANYAECYIEVVKSKVVAIISGGWKKTVNNKHQIIISAEKSYNPKNKRKTNQDLKFSWSCSPQCGNIIGHDRITYVKFDIPKNMIEYNKTYNFTVKVSAYGLEDGWASQEVYVSDEDMSVFCLMNCLKEMIPSDPLLLEVRIPSNNQLRNTFEWTITHENGTKVGADVTCEHHTFPSYLLCVGTNSLNYGKTYNFLAKKAGSSAVAGIKVIVVEYPTFSCFVTPSTKGVQLITSFSVSCSNPGGHTSWTYEFFDIYDSDLNVTLNGRMLATNNMGELQDFKMFRGTIFVYLYDINGGVAQWNQTVQLTLYTAAIDDIVGLFADTQYMIGSNKLEQALMTASLVTELIGPESDKSYIAERMVNLLCEIPYENQRIMKLGLITVKNFIISLTKEGDYKIDPSMLKSLAQVIHSSIRLTDYVTVLSNTAVPAISYEILKQMATASLEAIEILLLNRNKSFLDTSLEDLSTSEYEDAKHASTRLESSLNRIGRALSFRQGTGYIKTSIVSSTKLSLITVQSDYLKLIANTTNEDKHFPIKVPEKLIKDLSSVEELGVHLTILKYNPFWTGRRDISTNLLSLDLYNKHSVDFEMTEVDYINRDIDLFVEVLQPTSISVTVVVTQFDASDYTEEDNDRRLKVLRLDLASYSKLFVSFLFEESGDEIKVYVSKKVRPDYELVNSSRTIISSNNSNYEKSVIDAGDSDSFVYIGILPGPNIRVNGTVNVTVHFYYHLCLTWLRLTWVSQYCRVGPTTNTSIIHCSCSHLSFFSAVFAVPPNEIDPLNDISLFLTLKENWHIVVFMACILVIFISFGVWAEYKDASDKILRRVLVLEDNFPEDKNYYLISVHTGLRMNAGTEANVGIQIFGSESSSRRHILTSKIRKVLNRGSEDWFMIQTLLPLGAVTQIHVWHDNSGVSPDWYCSKLVVCDLHNSAVYTFFVEQWLGFELGEFGEAVLLPATYEDTDDIKRIIIDNMIFGFRDASMSGSILARHPRSRVRRLDRVVIFMCFIMLALLVSIAFYKFPSNEYSEGYDSFNFSFDSKDVLRSLQTFVISAVLIFFISVSFRKAYNIEHYREDSSSFVYTFQAKTNTLMETRSQTTMTSSTSSREHDTHFHYNRLVRRMQNALNPLPLRPVIMSTSSDQVKTNRIPYFAAWMVSILVVTFCVFFTALYGLKLGREESKKWIASVTLVLVQQFVIMSPLKIVFIGIVLAITLGRFEQISKCRVIVEEFPTATKERDAQLYSHLTKIRSHRKYKPLSVGQRDMLWEKQREKRNLHNLIDLLVVTIYIVIIFLVANDYSIQVQCNSNFHVSHMVHLMHRSKQFLNFKDIYNMTLYNSYVGYTLVNSLYERQWYNNKNFNLLEVKDQWRSMWWTMDKITKLVGPPVCRQIRVNPNKCTLNQMTKNISVECIPNWGPGVEDDEDYDFGWKLATSYKAGSKETNAWKYVFPSQSNRVSRQGESWTTYHGGGYMVSLSSDRFESSATIEILKESKWINEFTRVIFLDFTIFNVNENMFTEVVLIAEHLPFGLYITRSILNSVKLDFMVHSVWKVGFVLFILIIVFHLIKIFRIINRQGFVKFFSEFGNIYMLFVTGLGTLSILFFVVHLKTSLGYTEMFQRRGLDVFFDFDTIVYYSVLSADTLTILFCSLTFRVFSLLPLGEKSLNIYYTLLDCGKSMACFLVMILVYIFVFCRLISYLLNYMLYFSAVYWYWCKEVHKSSTISETLMLFLQSLVVKIYFMYWMILLLFRYQLKLKKEKKVDGVGFTVFYKSITRPTINFLQLKVATFRRLQK